MERAVEQHKKSLSTASNKMMKMKYQNTFNSLSASLELKRRELSKTTEGHSLQVQSRPGSSGKDSFGAPKNANDKLGEAEDDEDDEEDEEDEEDDDDEEGGNGRDKGEEDVEEAGDSGDGEANSDIDDLF